MGEHANLEKAIEALEAQRATLGDEVVDSAVALLSEKLATLKTGRSPSEQQRKQTTVMLADLSGFTAMSATRDVEEISDTMNALWGRIDAVILEHGGMIDKHIGDAVMALWGVGQAREDDPERAVRAALEMQAGLAAFQAEHGVPLAMRIGINTGPVLLGDVGTTGEFSAIGGTVNLTRRLEQAAPPGSVLISQDAYRHVRGIFEVKPQEPVVVSGEEEGVPAYVILRAKPRAFRMRTRGVEGIETHMVGRDSELQELRDILREVMAGASTRLVTITGEAGVGKSRLLDEVDDWIELLPERIWYFVGRASPELRAMPYGVIRDVFAHRFEILESDGAATVLDKFRAGTAGILDPDQADLVGHMVGFDFSTSPAVKNLLGSPSFGQLATAYLTTYIRAMAARPMVLFLEDIHWADESSLDLITDLVATMPDVRLLVVCLARPLLFERRPDWGTASSRVLAGRTDGGGQQDTHTRIELNPLSEDDSRVLVGEILRKADRVPAALRDLVVEGAEGNPYYVEELIKMLIEDGVIVRGEERWRIEIDRLTEVRVPSTLTGVLQARLDSLPRNERVVLQRASVVGRLFWGQAVAELVGDAIGGGGVKALLDDLSSRELVYPQPHSAFAGTDEYIFRHAILHNVTYETVLLKRRRVYHAQAAKWLEANAGERLEEYLGLIAGHYERAGENSKAAGYLHRAGEERYEVSAYRDAITAFERALALLGQGDAASRGPLLVSLGQVHRLTGDYAAALPHLKEGMRLAHEEGDRQAEVTALNGLGLTVRVQGDCDEAERYLVHALKVARDHGNRGGIAVCQYNLGDVAYRRGKSDEAERYAAASLEICREVGDRQGIAFALRVLGFAALLRGEYDEAVRRHEESMAAYSEIGDRWGVAACFINLGEIARKQGKFEEAVGHYEESLAIALETGAHYEVVICRNNLGHVHSGLGDDDKAREYICQALRESSVMGVVPIVLEGLVGMAELQMKAGQHEEAAELLGVVLGHPSFFDETRQYADPVIAALREVLPTPRLEAALARGRLLELEGVVEGILAEGGDR